MTWPIPESDRAECVGIFRAELRRLWDKQTPWRYEGATVVRVVDGDTVDLSISRDVGFRVVATVRPRVRLLGIDTPERGQPGYAEAGAMLADLIEGKVLTVLTWKADSFDRWLARLMLPDTRCVTETMLMAGMGRPWSRR